MELLTYLVGISLLSKIIAIPVVEFNSINQNPSILSMTAIDNNEVLTSNDNYNENTTKVNLLNENKLQQIITNMIKNKSIVNIKDADDNNKLMTAASLPQFENDQKNELPLKINDVADLNLNQSVAALIFSNINNNSNYNVDIKSAFEPKINSKFDLNFNTNPEEVSQNPENFADKGEGELRQATQTTQGTITTPSNFVQQLIQNSPFGPFLNQLSGQNNVNDDNGNSGVFQSTSPPVGGIPPSFLNPIQSVVNSTTQAFQGLQQFASSIGNQFQSTLSNFAGQAQQQFLQATTTTTRPNGGPIQQFVSTFIGGINSANNLPSQQQSQAPQGPLQGIFNILQGQSGNRPSSTVSSVTAVAPFVSEQPVDESDIPSKINDEMNENVAANAGEFEINITETMDNLRKDDEDVETSFEENGEDGQGIIVVNDDVQNDDDDGNYNLDTDIDANDGLGRSQQKVINHYQGTKIDGGQFNKNNQNDSGNKSNANKKKKKRHELVDGSAVAQK